MAREIVYRCDAAITVRVKDCSEVHDDMRTFTIQVDGEAWELDLGGPHAEALVDLARRGRPVESSRRPQDNRSLERRIRNVPPEGP
jgi:hypothetical protein